MGMDILGNSQWRQKEEPFPYSMMDPSTTWRYEPSDKELDMYPIIELTSPLPWDIQSQLASLRRSKRKLIIPKKRYRNGVKDLVRYQLLLPRRLWNQPPSLWKLWRQRQGQCLTSISRLECLHWDLEDVKKETNLIRWMNKIVCSFNLSNSRSC